jgi:hypothetical protein
MLLECPDVSFVNVALSGADTSSFVRTSIWTNAIAPTLTAYDSNKFVFLEGGYNDLGTGETVSQLEASYTSLAGTAHSDAAKMICDADVIRNATQAINLTYRLSQVGCGDAIGV